MLKSIQFLVVKCWKFVSPVKAGSVKAGPLNAGPLKSGQLRFAEVGTLGERQQVLARNATVAAPGTAAKSTAQDFPLLKAFTERASAAERHHAQAPHATGNAAQDFPLLKAFTKRATAQVQPVIQTPIVDAVRDFPSLAAFQAAVLAAAPLAENTSQDDTSYDAGNTELHVAPANAAVVWTFPAVGQRRANNLLAAQLRAVAVRNTPASRKKQTVGVGGKRVSSAQSSTTNTVFGGAALAQRRGHSVIASHRPKTKLAITKRSPRRRHVWLAGTAKPRLARPTASIIRFQVRHISGRDTIRPHRIAA